MPNISAFNCPQCGKRLLVRGIAAGQRCVCIYCGRKAVFAVPAGKDEVPVDIKADEKQLCPGCGELLEKNSETCARCGTSFNTQETDPKSGRWNIPLRSKYVLPFSRAIHAIFGIAVASFYTGVGVFVYPTDGGWALGAYCSFGTAVLVLISSVFSLFRCEKLTLGEIDLLIVAVAVVVILFAYFHYLRYDVNSLYGWLITAGVTSFYFMMKMTDSTYPGPSWLDGADGDLGDFIDFD